MRLIIFMFCSLLLNQALANGRAYLNTEEGEIVSVFNKPGMNWKNCTTDKSCKAVGWPDRTAEIEVVSPVKKMRVVDPYTGELSDEEYVQVKYKYKRETKTATVTQEGQGWIDNAYISYTKQKTFYGTSQASEPLGSCRAKDYPGAAVSDLAKDMGAIQQAIANKGVTGTADAVKPFVGACVIDPKQKNQSYRDGNPYDNYVLPKVVKQKVPTIKKENGENVTAADLVSIDALSRTLYAEMARCYKNGLQYPMTVAKIAVNRADTPSRHKEFIKDDHHNSKTDLAKVVTSPTQFSLWLRKINGKPNNSLKQALCPPSEKDKSFWTGNKPSQAEIDIWDNTVKIATEAVLFPKKFNARTSQVKQYFYTSGMPGFYGMNKVVPVIEDHKATKEACIQVWEEKKKGRG